MAPPKKRTPAQVRDRRSKIAAVVLSVVFLGVGVIQGPKLLKELHPSAPAAADSTPPPSSASSGGSASLAAVTLTPGQLRRFTTFAIRDPFKAQVAATASGSTGATGATGASGSAQKTGATGTTGPAATFTETVTGAGATPARTVPAALILYNGKRQLVPLGMGFPKKKPMFRLVSLGLKNVRIGLIGGSFANGKTTLALVQNRKVTLADSTSGSKFVLRLLRLTTAPAPVATPGGGSSKQPAATTTPAASTTGG